MAWLKNKRTNQLLEPLAPVIDGQVSDGRLTGRYGGYSVEAHPRRGYPIKYMSSLSQGSTGPAEVDMLQVTLGGVGGRNAWHCQSSPGSAAHDLASRFTAGGLLGRFRPGEFKFERVDSLNDSMERMMERLVRRLGVPITASADPELQQRLIAAGLFDELSRLRWGAHPYLPKVAFTPPAHELAQVYMQSSTFESMKPALEERLRDAGFPDLDSAMAEHMREADATAPGLLVLDVEVGKARAPTAERFQELLEHAVRIAEINLEANPPAGASESA